jgi:hypothetical protein
MALSRKMWKIFVIFLGIISIVNAGGDTLVLLDNLAIKETHSMFFKSLQGWFYHLQKKCRFYEYLYFRICIYFSWCIR